MKKRKRITLRLIVLVLFSFSLILPNHVYAQDEVVEESPELSKAKQLLIRLSPEEKIGQLFLVTFDGSDVEKNLELEELISKYHVGGVVLKRENDNFPASDLLLENTYKLIHDIQSLEYKVTDEIIRTEDSITHNDYIPLFIGISQNGDGFPHDQILSELTPIPSFMSIGSTWDRTLSENIGKVLGKELKFLGFNLFFGPSLDLSENKGAPEKDDLGVQTFGGDPYWVGELGKSFIKGIKTGSKNGIAVIAKYFPGSGSSDRLLTVEVATVQKSLEQLKLYELAPFFSVTNQSQIKGDGIADGLLINHIRYQGFQGNIRATTKPVSFDSAAIEQLMSISPFTTWRESGGMLVSEDLGSEAIRKFFNPSNQNFDARQIARTAFLAGNDLLLMDELVSTGDENRFETYKNILDFFVQKYKEDQVFSERVDNSVLRILVKKYQLYSTFDFYIVDQPKALLTAIGNSGETVFEIASNSAALINPHRDQVLEILQHPPQKNERITIFTDVRFTRQCSTCEDKPIIAVNYFEKALLKLYGPTGSAELIPRNLISYTFLELNNYLEDPFNYQHLEENISKSDWILFITSDQNSPDSNAMGEFLSRSQDLIEDKKIILFAMGPPYYYDATEISGFSAFYCLFSKTEHFFELAARILFQEAFPKGASPVSIPAISYDLISITSPDPGQIIEIAVDETIKETSQNTDPEAQAENGLDHYSLGDNLPVITGEIIDHNGNPVPDGTVVRFLLNQRGENVTVQQVESTTKEGIAKALMLLQNPGLHEIRVSSEPATNSQILLLDISEEEGAIISAITPTPKPTLPTEIISPDEIAQPTETVSAPEISKSPILQWLVVVVFSWVTGLVVFNRVTKIGESIERAKLSLVIISGGLLSGLFLIFWAKIEFLDNGLSGYLALVSLTIVVGLLSGGLYRVILQASRKENT